MVQRLQESVQYFLLLSQNVILLGLITLLSKEPLINSH